MLGQLLEGRYQIIQTLAQGGFGQTYIAEDIHRPGHPKCVVKQLHPASRDPHLMENARRLFTREAETLERLGNHDQIPRLLAYFEENQEFFLVQDLIDGTLLTSELLPGQRWTEAEICQLLSGVLTILAFIHGQGVIHRDIKPDNIIRRYRDRKLVLVDFGSVKEVRAQFGAPQTVTGTVIIGTPGYMSTEQGRGRPRPNSDIYSLGIIAIQAATGLHPSQLQEDTETGELLWRPWAMVRPELATILNRMVRYHFKERYQTALDAIQDLIPLLERYSIAQEVPQIESFPSNGAVGNHLQALGRPVPEPTKVLRGEPAGGQSQVRASSRSTAPTVVSRPEERSKPPRASSQSAPQPTVVSIPSPPNEVQAASIAAEESPQPRPDLLAVPHSERPEASVTSDLPAEMAPETPEATVISIASDLSESPSAKAAEPLPSPPVVSPLPPEEIDQPEASDSAHPLSVSPELNSGYRVNTDIQPMTESAVKQNDGSSSPNLKPFLRPSGLRLSWLRSLHPWVMGISLVAILAATFGFWVVFRRLTFVAMEPQLSLAQPGATAAHTLLDPLVLNRAKDLAAQSQLRAAMQLAATVSLPEAQALAAQWADQMLQIATNKYESGQLEEAIQIAGGIPASSAIADQAQSLIIPQWRQDWQRNQERQATAEAALRQGNWPEAIKVAETMGGTQYWRDQANRLIQQAKTAQQNAALAASRSVTRSPSPPSRSSSSSRSSPSPPATRRTPSRSSAPSGGSSWEVEKR